MPSSERAIERLSHCVSRRWMIEELNSDGAPAGGGKAHRVCHSEASTLLRSRREKSKATRNLAFPLISERDSSLTLGMTSSRPFFRDRLELRRHNQTFGRGHCSTPDKLTDSFQSPDHSISKRLS